MAQAQERVDKRWQEQGLEKYSTEAILGTLAHYGVSCDEAGFRGLAKDKYPLGIAYLWAQAWKGTGQFKLFPSAAAAELWKRLEEGRMAPAQLAEAVVELLGALQQLLSGAPDAPVGAAFKKVDALKPGLPQKDGKIDEGFVAEMGAYFTEDAWRTFDETGEALARAGHLDDAMAFAELEEQLLAERKGIATALVRAVGGEREKAVEQLEGIAKGGEGADLPRRLTAVEGLFHLGEEEKAVQAGGPLLDDAEKAEDLHVALGIGRELYEHAKRNRDAARTRELEGRLEKLFEAHERLHPHHHH